MKQVTVYPGGGAGIVSGQTLISFYGWSSLWMVEPDSYVLTLEDSEGKVITTSNIRINNLPGVKQPKDTKPDCEVEIVRPGSEKPGPIVTIRKTSPDEEPIDPHQEEKKELLDKIKKMVKAL